MDVMWTAPRTYVTGEIVTSTILNTDHRDNLAAIRLGLGAAFVVTQDDADKVTNATIADQEKNRGAIPLNDFIAGIGGSKIQLRLIGTRLATTQGGAGSNEVKIQAGTRTVGATGDPTFTTVTNVPSVNPETTATWKDTGWVDLPGGLTLTDAILVVRYTATANNTGQVTTTRMTCLARVVS